jgi:hypothetical protein
MLGASAMTNNPGATMAPKVFANPPCIADLLAGSRSF